ncbi:MAG: patatin-like phospholipase family protein [Clostridia bacterium]|nr:patatin-like phospholipase family protein [Clostridia bacterium]
MYGIALEGGGTKGAYQLGAWKALRELGIQYNVVAGSSIGSLNGALMAMDAYDEALELWQNIDPSMIIKGDAKLLKKISKFSFDYNDFHEMVQFTGDVIINGGLDVSPLRKLIGDIIDEDIIRQSPVRLGMVTVNLTDMKPVETMLDDIPRGKLGDYILASCSLPVFQRNYIDDKLFLDGGFHDNLPLNLVASTGCKKIIAIEIKGTGRRHKINDPSVEVIHIVPSEDTGGLLEFDQNRAHQNIKMGYYDTLRIFKNLRGQRYYLDHCPEESVFISWLLELTDDQILGLGKSLGIRRMSAKRMLFEKIIPELAVLLGVSSKKDYSDLFISLYEYCAGKMGMERYEVYDTLDFFEAVEKQLLEWNGIGSKDDSYFGQWLKSTGLYNVARKDEVLMDILFKTIIMRQ